MPFSYRTTPDDPLYGGPVPTVAVRSIEVLRLLAIGLLGLVGQAGVLLTGWGVVIGWSAMRRGLSEPIGDGWPGWLPLAIGLVAIGLGGALVSVALAGIRRLRSGLDTSWPRLFALLLAMDAAGIAIGVGRWIDCYHQADILRTWGLMVLVGASLVALAAAVVSRPGSAAIVLVVPALAVAFVSYDRLVDATAATRCARYQSDPVPAPPQPTVPHPGDRPTGDQTRPASTTAGPPLTTTATTKPER